MGLPSIQDYAENSPLCFVPLFKYLEEIEATVVPRVVIVHADSCLRHFYQEYSDWICGGQWRELHQNIQRFVNAFRQNNIEPIIFMNGNLDKYSKYEWQLKHNRIREIVKEVLSHVQHNSTIPFRKRTRDFIYPGSLLHAVRLAFRSCDVVVCSTLEDAFKESILYSKDNNSLGIIGNDANFILYNTSNYINLGIPTRWSKKLLPSCRILDIELLLRDLGLQLVHLPYFASLLGNFCIPDNWLSSFFWDLVEDDHPVKKLQSNLDLTAVLPPAEMRIKCVANFLKTHNEILDDAEKLAEHVFGKNEKISLQQGTIILNETISYYKDKLKASNSLPSCDKDFINNLSLAGYPLPLVPDVSTLPNGKYKRCWEPPEKPKSANLPLDNDPTENETLNLEKLDNPEEIIRQGTLEEAAQALEQLELNENSSEEDKEVNDEKVSISDISDAIIIATEEKPQRKEESTDDKHDDEPSEDYPRDIKLESIVPDINEDVLLIARRRHQSGQMCPEILQLLLKGEISLHMTLDDEDVTDRLQIPLLYRPLRQLVYGILFSAKQRQTEMKAKSKNVEKNDDVTVSNDDNNDDDDVVTTIDSELNNNSGESNHDDSNNDTESDDSFKVKEWCIHSNKPIEEPDLVSMKGMCWGVPPLKKLWFGMNSEDNANRLKAFLSCMKSDTVNMSNTAMVPHRLMLLSCVLRYLVQQAPGQTILSKQDIDAFLAQALSPQLTLEENSQNLPNLKLSRVDSRCIQLAAIFMKGIENAILANDACGSPVPWEYCCPWNFFNGKLFHSKWLQSSMNINTIELCEGKPHLAEKLERLRWCITEGLDSKYSITGLQNSRKFYNPFATPPNMQQLNPSARMMKPGAGVVGVAPVMNGRTNRGRGSASRRPVSGNGATLHVAGVPVAHWNGNKSGIGYSKNAPNVLVGGPASVDLPSDHRSRVRAAYRYGRGRGLLETPYISPWQQGPGFEDFMQSTYAKYLKGAQKAEQVRAKIGKLGRGQLYTAGKSTSQSYLSNAQNNRPISKDSHFVGKGRDQQLKRHMLSANAPAYTHRSYGRGNWLYP